MGTDLARSDSPISIWVRVPTFLDMLRSSDQHVIIDSTESAIVHEHSIANFPLVFYINPHRLKARKALTSRNRPR